MFIIFFLLIKPRQQRSTHTDTLLPSTTLIRSIDDELATGHVAVVQLTSTAEAILGRRLADLSPEERANLSIDVSPLDTLIDYLRTAFPTRQMRAFRATDGSMRSEIGRAHV